MRIYFAIQILWAFMLWVNDVQKMCEFIFANSNKKDRKVLIIKLKYIKIRNVFNAKINK